METEVEAVVVPLVPTATELSTEAMLRMLLDREALLIERRPNASKGTPSGLVAQSSGAFAKAVSQVMGHTGRAAPVEGLYRVVMPTGAVARDLVPAIGGGFRGMVRTGGSSKFSGQVRLLPAATGAGATIAAGPLIATIGLAVAGELLAQHQTNKKLQSIKSGLVELQSQADEQARSVLVTADKQARKVAGYLLDQAAIPTISSAGHAFGELDALTNRYVDRLDRWLETVEKYSRSDRVHGRELMTALVGNAENSTHRFEWMVTQTYEALALRARVVVLEKVAAEFSNPDRSLPQVERILRDELAVISDRQSQLVGLLDDLSVMQIDSSKVPVTFAGKGVLSTRTSFSRMVRALHQTPDSLPVLTDSDQTVLELAPTSGGLSVEAPKGN